MPRLAQKGMYLHVCNNSITSSNQFSKYHLIFNFTYQRIKYMVLYIKQYINNNFVKKNHKHKIKTHKCIFM